MNIVMPVGRMPGSQIGRSGIQIHTMEKMCVAISAPPVPHSHLRYHEYTDRALRRRVGEEED